MTSKQYETRWGIVRYEYPTPHDPNGFYYRRRLFGIGEWDGQNDEHVFFWLQPDEFKPGFAQDDWRLTDINPDLPIA